MEPTNWDGKSIEPGVKRRLRRLDRYLRVTYSPYSLDTFTGYPILRDGTMDTETGEVSFGPVLDHANYLWRKDPNSSHHFFVKSYSVYTGGFTHLSVRHLEGDVARHLNPSDAWRLVKERTDRNRLRQASAHKQHLTDKVLANKELALDIAKGKRTDRVAKVVSYAGQRSHTSSSERSRISMENRELGIEE